MVWAIVSKQRVGDEKAAYLSRYFHGMERYATMNAWILQTDRDSMGSTEERASRTCRSRLQVWAFLKTAASDPSFDKALSSALGCEQIWISSGSKPGTSTVDSSSPPCLFQRIQDDAPEERRSRGISGCPRKHRSSNRSFASSEPFSSSPGTALEGLQVMRLSTLSARLYDMIDHPL